MRYAVVIERAGRNFSAYVRIFPDALRPEQHANRSSVASAMRFHIDGLVEDGQAVPKPTSVCEYVEA